MSHARHIKDTMSRSAPRAAVTRRDLSDDIALARRCAAGDNDAWQTFQRQYKYLFIDIVRKQGMMSDFDQVMSDFNAKLLGERGALARYRGAAPLNWYCALILNHTIVDHVRARNGYHAVHELAGDEINEVPVAASDYYDDETDLKLELLQKSLAQLPDNEQSIVRMHYMHKRTFVEMARLLATSPAGAFRQLKRIERKLAALIQEMLALHHQGVDE